MKSTAFLSRLATLLLVATSILFIGMAFTAQTKGPKPFIVAGLKQSEIDKGIRTKLTNAYKAQFGSSAMLETIQLVKNGHQTWLWFVGTGNNSPTFGIEIRVVDGKLALQFGEPLGINNCLAQGSCTKCKVDCGCARNGGSGECETKITEKILGDEFDQFAASLSSN